MYLPESIREGTASAKLAGAFQSREGTLLNWRRSLKVGLASVVATAFVLAGSYGVADAAAPSFFHGHGRHSPRTLSGTVTSVGTGSFTLQVRHDRSLTVLTTSTTKFRESGSPDPVMGVAVGEHVVVFLVPRHRQEPPTTSTTVTTTTSSTGPRRPAQPR